MSQLPICVSVRRATQVLTEAQDPILAHPILLHPNLNAEVPVVHAPRPTTASCKLPGRQDAEQCEYASEQGDAMLIYRRGGNVSALLQLA